MTIISLFHRIRRDESGATIIEFALLAPMFLLMLMGVLQVGVAMQNYNALRNLSADVARMAMVQYQTGNSLTNSQIETWAENHALGAPYLLDQNRVNAVVTTPGTQRVAGATELQIVISYQIDSFLDFAGIDSPFITYTRPVFLLDS
ncbi:TadE/TadG family type IV pilus assembly protein [Aurantiacibacter poecillastricola]|uniref:TadE/TadG family type IV pilus assembly protein n=1 Tax=Aurantiacibacter poecillastricola TaxID=3064385 RepID=UPI00273D992A|nr:TadE/TadG family type IV pilus assembly protein [Aurantiacibacter sp. 219JJ12-13]MDP5262075.1 pilus assembly protein [Aurantiacibacter sp. 219JJ12-13]